MSFKNMYVIFSECLYLFTVKYILIYYTYIKIKKYRKINNVFQNVNKQII